MKLILSFILGLLLVIGILGQTKYQKNFEEFGVEGSTTIYDYKNKKWFFTNKADANQETLPASTFKILNTLIILENNLVKDENEIVKWDGTEHTFFGTRIDAWNKDTNLETAYKNSTVWFYVEMANRLGRSRYKNILKKVKYGNRNFSEKGTDFWNFGEFDITPKNQIKFLIKLYENKLPFSKSNISKVKEIMISEQTDDYVFRDKTGWTKRDGTDIGWWIGYLQTQDNVYFFATRLTKSTNENNPNFSKARKEITKQILSELSILPQTTNTK